MTKRRFAARDPIHNSTILTNEVFQLDLQPTAIAVYAYLRRLENADYQCWPSYANIAEAVGCSKRTVPKYVYELCEKRLASVERKRVWMKRAKQHRDQRRKSQAKYLEATRAVCDPVELPL